MLALEKWGQGRWKPLVMFAHTVALGAEPVYKCCVAAHDPKFRDFLARVEDKAAWLENYHGQAFLTIDPAFGAEILPVLSCGERWPELEAWFKDLHAFVIATPEERQAAAKEFAKELKDSGATWTELFAAAEVANVAVDVAYGQHLDSLRRELKENPAIDAAWLSLLQKSARARFFFLVVIPSWMEFGKSPTELFDRARSGDFDSLCMLLNLDHLCLRDERIAGQFHKHMESNEVRRGKLLDAMKYKPLKKLKTKAIKVLLGALVYKVFNRVHDFTMEWQKKLWKNEANHVTVRRHELTFAAVRKLLDAVYSDVHEAMIPDPDFSGITPDAFALSVKRDLPFWAQV